jgi:hypothetical protein
MLRELNPQVSRLSDDMNMLNARESLSLNSFKSLISDSNTRQGSKTNLKESSFNSTSEPNNSIPKTGSNEGLYNDNILTPSGSESTIGPTPILTAGPSIDEIFGTTMEWIGIYAYIYIYIYIYV